MVKQFIFMGTFGAVIKLRFITTREGAYQAPTVLVQKNLKFCAVNLLTFAQLCIIFIL